MEVFIQANNDACKDCRRQFVENPQNSNQAIPPDTIAFIDRLLLE